MMFDPNTAKSEKALKARKKKATIDIKNWAMLLVPEPLREGMCSHVTMLGVFLFAAQMEVFAWLRCMQHSFLCCRAAWKLHIRHRQSSSVASQPIQY